MLTPAFFKKAISSFLSVAIIAMNAFFVTPYVHAAVGDIVVTHSSPALTVGTNVPDFSVSFTIPDVSLLSNGDSIQLSTPTDLPALNASDADDGDMAYSVQVAGGAPGVGTSVSLGVAGGDLSRRLIISFDDLTTAATGDAALSNSDVVQVSFTTLADTAETAAPQNSKNFTFTQGAATPASGEFRIVTTTVGADISGAADIVSSTSITDLAVKDGAAAAITEFTKSTDFLGTASGATLAFEFTPQKNHVSGDTIELQFPGSDAITGVDISTVQTGNFDISAIEVDATYTDTLRLTLGASGLTASTLSNFSLVDTGSTDIPVGTSGFFGVDFRIFTTASTTLSEKATGVIFTDAEAQAAVDAVNAAADASAMEAVLETNATALGIDLTTYNGLSSFNQAAVAQSVFNGIGGGYADAAAVKTAFDAAVTSVSGGSAVIDAVNGAADAASMQTVLESNAVDLGLTTTTYETLTSAQKLTVAQGVFDGIGGGYADLAAIQTAFNNAVSTAPLQTAINTVNTAADATALQTAIEADATQLGIDLTAYNLLDATRKDAVMALLLTARGGGFADEAAIQTAFATAVSAEEVANTLNNVNSAVDATAFQTALETYGPNLGLDFTTYNTLSAEQKTGIAQSLFDNKGSGYSTTTDLSNAFNTAVTIAQNPDDSVAPVINDAHGISPNRVEVFFTETNGLDLSDGSFAIDVSPTLGTIDETFADGNRLEFKTQNSQVADTVYTVTFTKLKDFPGNELTATSGGGTTDNQVTFTGFNATATDNGTAPFVEFTSPAMQAFGVPPNSKQVQIGFSENMDSTTLTLGTNIELRFLDSSTGTFVTLDPADGGGSQTEGTFSGSYDDQNAVYKITTQNNLQTSTRYEVRVSGAVQDLAGTAMGGDYFFEFETSGTVDSTPPTVQGTNLSSTGVSVTIPKIEISFSEDMDGSTIITNSAGSASSNIRISKTEGTVTTYVSGEVFYDPASFQATFVPKEALTANSDYTLTVSTNVKDLAGVALASAYTSNFTTGDADTTKPEVTWADVETESQAAGTSQVPVSIFISFNKPMDVTDVESIANYTFEAGADMTSLSSVDLTGAIANYDAAFNGVEISGGSLQLDPGSYFRITVASSVTDTAGNTINTTADSTLQPRSQDSTANTLNTWEGQVYNAFDFVDPLYIEDSYPYFGGQSIATNVKLMVKFNKEIQSSSLDSTNATESQRNIRLYALDGSFNPTGAAIAGTATLLSNNKTIVFAPDSNLSTTTQYRFIIGNDDTTYAVKASDGTQMDYPFFVEFTTGSGADSTAAKAQWSYPVAKSFTTADSIDASFYTDNTQVIELAVPKISVGFSEVLDPSTINTSNVILATDPTDTTTKVAASVAYNSFEQAIDIFPSEILSTNTAYTIRIGTGVKDNAGNALAANADIVFQTTSTADTTKPKISSAFVDTYGIFIQFSEPVKQSLATSKENYSIQTSPDTISDTTASKNMQNATIEYLSFENSVFIKGLSLNGNDNIRVTVSTNITDLSGNALSTETDADTSDGHKDGDAYNVFNGTVFSITADSTAPKILRTERFDPYVIEVVFDEPNGLSLTSSSGSSATINSDLIKISLDGGSTYQTLSALSLSENPEILWDRVLIHLTQSDGTTLEAANGGVSTFYIQFTGLQDQSNNVLTATSHGGSADNVISFTAFDAANFNDGGEPPFVTFTSPPRFEANVPSGMTTLKIGFNKSMDIATVTNASNVLVKKLNTGTGAYDAVTVDSRSFNTTNKELILTINAGLATNSEYQVTVKGDIQDSKGAAIGWDDVYGFWTSAAADSTAPQISGTSLTSGTTVSPLLNKIEVYFDEDIDGSTVVTQNAGVSTSTVNLSYSSQGTTKYVPGKVEYDPWGWRASLFLTEALQANTQYTLTVKKTLADFSGNTLATKYTQTFTTSDQDSSKPKVVYAEIQLDQTSALGGFDSAAGTAVSGDAKIFIQFDKPMDQTAVQDLSNYTLLKGSSSSAITTSVDISNANAEYHPDFNGLEIYGGGLSITEGEYFKITVASTLTDLGGNAMDTTTDSVSGSPRDIDGTANTYNEWEGQIFNPFDFVEPLFVEDVSPQWGSQSVAINTFKITAKFNRALKSSTVSTTNVKLYEVNTADWTNSSEITLSSVSVLEDGKTILSQVDTTDGDLVANKLKASTTYRFIAGEGATKITDTDGIPLEYPVFLEFQTSAGEDSTAPTVLWSDPDNTATGVSVGLPNIFIGMSESIDSSTLTSTNIKLWADDGNNTVDGAETTIATSIKYDAFANIINVQPQSVLAASTQYTIQLGTGVTDAAGNALASAANRTFTTGAADSGAPQIFSAYADNFGLFVQFTEPVKESLATASSNYTIITTAGDASDSSNITPLIDAAVTAGTEIQVSMNNAQLFYDAYGNGVWIDGITLNPGDVYRVTVSSSIKDLSGNAIDTSTDSDNAGPHPDGLAFNVFDGNVFGSGTADETAPKILRSEWIGPDLLEIIFDEPSGLADTGSSGDRITINSSVIKVNTGSGFQTLSAAGINDDPFIGWDRVQLFLPEGTTGTVQFTGLKDWENNVLTATSHGGSADNEVTIPTFDINAFDTGEYPYVTYTLPQRFMANVPTNASTIEIGFNKPMDASNVGGANSVTNPSNVVLEIDNAGTWDTVNEAGITRTYDSETNALKVTVNAGLTASSQYRVTIKGSIADKKSQQIGWDDFFEFWTAAGSDSTAPTINDVYYTTDSNGNVPVALPFIEIFMNEDIDGSTVMTQNAGINTSTVNISYSSQGSTKYVAGKVDYDPWGYVIRFFPDQVLKADTSYKLNVGTALKDLAGNALASKYTQSFTTADQDTTNAKVLFADAVLDQESALNTFDQSVSSVSGGARIFVQFDKAMNATAVEDLSNYTLTKGSTTSAITTAVDLSTSQSEYHPEFYGVEIWGGSISLGEGDYFKIVVASTVTDLAGNTMDTTTDSGTFSERDVDGTANPFNEWEGQVFNPFTFEDPLYVNEVSPDWGAWNVPTNNQKYMAKFNKDIKSSTVSTSNVKLYEVDTTDWTNGAEVTINTLSVLDDGRTILADTGTNLTADTQYRFIVGVEGASAITDTNGIPLEYPIFLEFKSAAGADSTAPTVLWSDPDNTETSISVGLPNIHVGMSEALDPSTLTAANIKLWIDDGAGAGVADNNTIDGTESDSSIPLKMEFDPYSYMIKIRPQTTLAASSEYTLQLDTGVTDVAGNGIVQVNRTFTTGTADNSSPQVLSGYADTYGIFVQFTEPVNETQATAKANYTLVTAQAPTSGTTTDQLTNNGTEKSLKNATLEYDHFANGVFIDGLSLTANNVYRITVDNNVTDLSGNALDTGADSDGAGPHPDGIAFNVFEGTIFDPTGYDESPVAMYSFPAPGDSFVPANIDRVAIGFSEALNAETLSATTAYIVPVQSDGTAGTKLSITPSFDTSVNEIVFSLDPSTGTDNQDKLATGTKYRIVVTTGVKDATGNTALSMDPQNPNGNAWNTEFKTQSANDSTAPEVFGTSIENWPWSGTQYQLSPTLGAIKVTFSEAMKDTTLKDLDASDAGSVIYVDDDNAGAGTKVSGAVTYNPTERTAKWVPEAPLTASTTYYFHVGTGAKDAAGNALAAMYTQEFVTTSADTKKPFIGWAEADEFEVRIFFNEPIKKKHAETKLNYTIESPITVKKSLDNASVNYIAEENLVIIKGLKMQEDETFLVKINSAANAFEDLAGNDIATAADTAADDSAGAGTEFDPNSGRDIGSSGRTADAEDTKFNEFEGYVFKFYDAFAESLTTAANQTDAEKDFAAFSDVFTEAHVFPWVDLAGETTRYGVDFYAATAIPAGAKIQIKFPEGFDISNTSAVTAYDTSNPDPDASWANADINGPATNTVTIASVSANKTARTITVVTAGGATNAGDFITLDLAGIVNSSVAKEYGTDGYTAEIKTVGTDGKRIEGPINTAPWFISPKGTGTISGTITGTGVDDNETIEIFLEGEKVGFLNKVLVFNDDKENASDGSASAEAAGEAKFSFSNLPNGQYRIWLDGINILNKSAAATEYQAPPIAELNLKDGANTKTFDVTLKDLSAATITNNLGQTINTQSVTVNVSGGPASGKVYWHIGNPENGVSEKQITLDGSGAGTATMKLPEGQYFTVVDPFPLQQGTNSSITTDASFVPPKPVEVKVNGSQDGSETAADTFTINLASVTANQYLRVTVQDSNSNNISDAKIFVSDPQGVGVPAKKTGTDGTVTFKLPTGDYKVGGKVEGLPAFPEKNISITSSHTSGSPATLSFTIKVNDNKISGKVLNGSSTVAGAAVFAQRVTSKTDLSLKPDFLSTFSDDNGGYSLFIPDNTVWKITAYIEGYGETDAQVIDPSVDSLTDVNLSLSSTLSEITGVLQFNGTAISDAVIIADAVDADGNVTGNFFAESKVDNTGAFTLRLKNSADISSNNYELAAFSPSLGYKVLNSALTVAGDADLGTTNIVENLRTITFNLVDTDGVTAYTATEAVITLTQSTGEKKFLTIENDSTASITVLAGTYDVGTFIEGVGKLDKLASQDFSADATVTITIPATTVTISGTVTDDSGNIENALVKIFDPNAGVENTTRTASDGTYSLIVPQNATYRLSARKAGYLPAAATDVTVSTSDITGNNITLVSESAADVYQITGTITLGSETANSNAFVTASQLDGTFVGAKVDALGAYSLSLKAGAWTLSAKAEGYTLETDVTITVSANATQNLTLAVDSAYTVTEPVTKPITPANGGVVNNPDAGVSLNIPAQALGSGSSSGSIQTKKTDLYPSTGDTNLQGSGVQIDATDSNGDAITNLQSSIQIEIDYSGFGLSAAEKEALQCSYFDDTINDWVATSGTNDTDNEKLLCTVDHFTVFGATTGSSGSSSSSSSSSTSTSSSSNSGGGGGGGGSVTSTSVNTTPYSIPVSESVTVAELSQPLSLSKTEGAITRPITLENPIYKHKVNIEKGTVVTLEDGSPFEGTISVPTTVPRSKRPPTPSGFQHVKMIEVGDSEGRSLTFSEPIALTIPVAFNDIVDPKQVKVYWYDEENEEYKLAGNGGYLSDDQKSILVEVDHMTKFAVMYEESPSELSQVETTSIPVFKFRDVSSHWAKDYIQELTTAGVFKDQSNFRPNDGLLRAELVKILVEAFDIPMVEVESEFSDVDESAWFGPYVAAAANAGIVKGYPDGTFQPGRVVNRAEALKMIVTAAGVTTPSGTEPFSDVKDSDWFKDSVAYAVGKGIVKGKSALRFAPSESVTRAEVAKMVSITITTH